MGLRGRLIRQIIQWTWGPLVRAVWTSRDFPRESGPNSNVPCPWCGQPGASLYWRWAIDEHFGLFERSRRRLAILYGTALPKWLPPGVISLCREYGFERIRGIRTVCYRRCSHCDLIYQDYPHRQHDVSAYYRDWYRVDCESTEDGSFGREDARWKGQQQQLADYFRAASTLGPGTEVLDAGCAEGWSCHFLEQAGLVAHGIEPSAQMVAFAKARLGLKHVRQGEYESSSYPAASFDGIISHHVVEHLVDLRAFGDAIGKHLKPGGWLLLQTPCADALEQDHHRAEICRGGHIYCFSQSFAERFVRELGLDVIESRVTPCERDHLAPEDQGPWNTSRWADDPCGVSVLARKRELPAS